MIDITNMYYKTKKDLEFMQEISNQTSEQIAENMGISKALYYQLLDDVPVENFILEKVYSYIYKNGYRLNSVKEDLLKESTKDIVLFHGSKDGLTLVSEEGSRTNCDFSNGFYLGERYENALSFVCDKKNSSVYSFTCHLDNITVVRFDCSLEWMLAICYFRGGIKEYEHTVILQDIIKKIKDADVIIAPIADNNMFYIMELFTNGEINANVALHSLAASKLGLQYVFKTSKGLSCLTPYERYYLCQQEKNEQQEALFKRSQEIETKLKLCRREYRDGLYIEEILK